jgi:hypothetical protein
MRLPKTGGATETLATVTGGQDVAAASGHVFFLQFGFPPSPAPGAIWKLDLPGSMPTQILNPTGPGVQIETDGTNAFVSGSVNVGESQDGLYRVTPAGQATKLVVVASATNHLSFALGPDFIVYASDGELRRIAKP